jgi:hypothetical protein
MANVKTMGGRRSRYWCGPGTVAIGAGAWSPYRRTSRPMRLRPASTNQNGARLSESGSGAPRILFSYRQPSDVVPLAILFCTAGDLVAGVSIGVNRHFMTITTRIYRHAPHLRPVDARCRNVFNFHLSENGSGFANDESPQSRGRNRLQLNYIDSRLDSLIVSSPCPCPN